MKLTNESIRNAVKAYRKSEAKVTNSKKVAESKTEKEKDRTEQNRQKLISKAIESLTKNLSAPAFSANQQDYIYKRQIADKAFESALESAFTFLNYKDQLFLEIGDQLIKVLATDLKEAAIALYKWSGIPSQRLVDKKGKPADHFSLWNSLVVIAAAFKRKCDRCKTSDEHLSDLVAACAASQPKITGNRDAAMSQLIDDTVKVSKRLRLDFAYNLAGSLFLDCSDTPYSMTKLDPKKVLPIFAAIIENSPIAGKLQASYDPQNLLDGFKRKQTRI